MAIPVARVHLKVAHAALPPLLPTPPKWKMLPLLPTPPPPCVTAILQAKLLATKPSRADSDERWDAHKKAKAKPAFPASHGSPPRKNATSPPPKPGRADSVERWDAHKKAAIPASSSSSGASSLASNSKWPMNRATSAQRWDVNKTKRCPPQAELLDDMDTEEEEEEEILWKPRSMYAGPGFVAAAPESSMLPMPTAFLVPVA